MSDIISNKSNRLPVILAGIVILALAIFGFMQFRSNTQKSAVIVTLQQDTTALRAEQDRLNALVVDVTQTVSDVGAKLAEVREKSVSISKLMTGTESKSKREQMLSDISAIEAQLQADNQNMTDLQEKLKKSSVRLRGLEKMVASLKKEIEDNQATIAQLRTTLEEKEVALKDTKEKLNTSQDNLKHTETKLQETSQTLTDTRNTAYYVVGKAKDLEAKNIIDRFGTFSKKNALSSEFDRSSFTKIDVTKALEFTVDCQAKDVKIVPPRSLSSYTIEDISDQKSVLKITNADEFWKVPYLALVVK